jgi:hypothetical protein
MTGAVLPMVPGSEEDDAPPDMKLANRPGQPHLGFTGTISTWTQDIRDQLKTTVEQQLASNINRYAPRNVRSSASSLFLS